MDDLLRKLQNLQEPDRKVDVEIACAVDNINRGHFRDAIDEIGVPGSGWTPSVDEWPPYTASVDAAITLARPGFSWVVHGPWEDGTYCAGCATTIGGAWDDDVQGSNAAIALCIAILEARGAEQSKAETT
jgi:hypothetical protein